MAETLGWLALGFSPSEALTDVDLLTAWVDDEGTGHIQVSVRMTFVFGFVCRKLALRIG